MMPRQRDDRARCSDAFVALPGGFGTLEEFCEVTTWTQLGLHHKPCALLNVERFFDPLLALLDHAASEGFILRDHRTIVLEESDPARLLDRLAEYCPPRQEKWIDLDET